MKLDDFLDEKSEIPIDPIDPILDHWMLETGQVRGFRITTSRRR